MCLDFENFVKSVYKGGDMKYPMEYWTGRMSGVLKVISKGIVDEGIMRYCAELVEEFEADFNEEDEVRDNDLHNSGYTG